ncbi:MAG: MBG-2 domain-containing protein, partial [Pseudomonadales bacterium]|nr:MBG-2 domain-containing protein [Pseudomonadales bacterium]
CVFFYLLFISFVAQCMFDTVVNNTGVIQAQTIIHHAGHIALMGDMNSGTVNVGGTLDASAPNGGNGGAIETSAAHVKIANAAVVTTQAAQGNNGNWLIDPVDFTVASSGGDETGAQLSTALSTGNVTIQSSSGGTGTQGNININDTVNPVTWSANTLTLNAYNNININAVMNGSGTATLALLYGQGSSSGASSTYNVNASINLSAGNNFSTQQGSTGAVINYTVITALGSLGSVTGTDLQGINGNLSTNYALGANIDASATSTAAWSWFGAGYPTGFVPIGFNILTDTTSSFTGIFEGLGHTIKNLNTQFNFNSSATNPLYAGLFAETSSASTVRDVGLVGGQITVQNTTPTAPMVTGGYIYEGQLVGNSAGAIINSYSSGTVTGSSGPANTSEWIGGLVGFASGQITSSNAAGNVTADSASPPANAQTIYGGGLVGGDNSVITNSFATGNVSGIGLQTTSTSLTANTVDVGGLVGYYNPIKANSFISISSSHASGAVSGEGIFVNVGGLVGNNSGIVNQSYAIGSASGTAVGQTLYNCASTMSVGGLVGLNSTLANRVSLNENGVSQSYATGSFSGTAQASGSGNTLYLGGLVGTNPGGVVNSYATGNGTASSNGSTVYLAGLVGNNSGSGALIYYSYATGLVPSAGGGLYTSGLVGTNSGSMAASFWDTTTSGTSLGVATGSISGSRGMATADMQNVLNYTGATAANGNVNPGWDLTNIWDVYSGYTYPLLRSFMTPLTVTAQNLTVTYSALANAGDASGIACSTGTCPTQNFFNASGFSGTSQGATNVGTYVINSSAYSDQQGYVITFVPGSLVINPATLTVTAGNASRSYGQANPTVVPTYSGFMGTDNATTALTTQPTVVTSAVATSPVGSYALTPQGAASSNYTFNYVSGSLTISPEILAMTASATSSTYGLALPTLTGYLSGLVNGDTQATVSTGTLNFTSPASITSDVGTYAINGSGLTLTNNNYQLAQAPSNAMALTVNPLPLTVQVQGNKVYDGTTALNNPIFVSNALSTNPVTIQGTAVYATTAGLGVGINASGLTFSGAHAADYSLTTTTASGSGNITPAPYFDVSAAPTSPAVTPAGLSHALQEVIQGAQADARLQVADMHVVLPGSDSNSQSLLTVTGDGMRWPQ